MNRYILKLYIAGHTPRSQNAIVNLRRICDEVFPQGAYELMIIDVLEQPELAEAAKILATPTLIKEIPPPIRRIIGDLADKEQVITWIEPQYQIHGQHGGIA